MIAVPNEPAIRCIALVRAVARGISGRGTAFIAVVVAGIIAMPIPTPRIIR
jgi:hypothetical protein